MRRKGVDLESELRRLAARLDRSGGGLSQAKIHTAWADVAGPLVTSHTTGAHLRDSELVVYVDTAVWATELSALAGPYQEALNQYLGEEVVKAVRFTVSRKVQEAFAHQATEKAKQAESREDDVPSVALTDQERAQVEASAAAIGDEELREAVIRATVADLEWKKGIEVAKSREKARQGL